MGASLNDAQSWSAVTNGHASSYEGSGTLAAFTSRGPTVSDSRIKPEVLGPGYFLYSAQARPNAQGTYHSGLIGKAGTSMATPAVAGMAAVVRQYFTEGYYYTTPFSGGSFNDSTQGFVPSGALLKAVLVAAGTKVSYVYYSQSSKYPLSAYPSNDQGYGRVQLNSVLNFGLASSSPLSLQVYGAAYSSAAQYLAFNSPSTITKSFTVAAGQAVRVVLAYTDKPGSSSAPAVQNVLTLSVTGTGGPYTPASLSGYSATNTVQLVSFTAASAGTYTATVTCTTLTGTQPFALVMVGAVSALPATTEDTSVTQSQLTLADIPYVNAIIAMAIVAGLLTMVTLGVFGAETLAERNIYFKLHKW